MCQHYPECNWTSVSVLRDYVYVSSSWPGWGRVQLNFGIFNHYYIFNFYSSHWTRLTATSTEPVQTSDWTVTYLVALSLLLAPFEQSISLGPSILSGQSRQWVFPLLSATHTHIHRRHVSKHNRLKRFTMSERQTHYMVKHVCSVRWRADITVCFARRSIIATV